MKKSKKISSKKELPIVHFDFFIETANKEVIDNLYDLILVYAGSHGLTVVDSFEWLSKNQLNKLTKED